MYILVSDGALSLLDNIRYFALNTLADDSKMCVLDEKYSNALLHNAKALDVIGSFDVVISRPDLFTENTLQIGLSMTRIVGEGKAKANLNKCLDYIHDILAGEAILAFINGFDEGVLVIVRIANGYVAIFEGREDALTAVIETFLFKRSDFKQIELR